jgi:hypothetical protein
MHGVHEELTAQRIQIPDSCRHVIGIRCSGSPSSVALVTASSVAMCRPADAGRAIAPRVPLHSTYGTRSSGTAIGRPRSGSCQVPTPVAYRTRSNCEGSVSDRPESADDRLARLVAPDCRSSGRPSCDDLPYGLKAGPADGRLRRPSSAGNSATDDRYNDGACRSRR